MNLNVSVQIIDLSPAELFDFKKFALSEFDVSINKHHSVPADEVVVFGAAANVRHFLKWHYQSLDDAKAMHPEAF